MQSVYYTGRIGSGRRKSSNLYTMEEFVDNIINDFPDIAEECQYSDDFTPLFYKMGHLIVKHIIVFT